MKLSWIGLILLNFASPTAAWAADLNHLVGPNESLSNVAKKYYGSTWKAVYLRAHNHLKDNEEAYGKRLVVPAAWLYTVRAGDSLATIAKHKLGDIQRYRAIMAFNNLSQPENLKVHSKLLLPFHLEHVVALNDTWVKISQRYYRTSRRANLLKEYNAKDNLKPGQKLTIPIFDSDTLDVATRSYVASPIKVEQAPQPKIPNEASANVLQEEPAAQNEAPTQSEPHSYKLRPEVTKATQEFKLGNFEATCDKLNNLLRLSDLNKLEKIELFLHLGFCAIAFDDPSAAQDYFRELLTLDPDFRLNQVETSPKIMAVFIKVLSGFKDPDTM